MKLALVVEEKVSGNSYADWRHGEIDRVHRPQTNAMVDHQAREDIMNGDIECHCSRQT